MTTTPIWKDVFVAAYSNDIDSVKWFIEKKGEPPTAKDEEGKTVAHFAAEFGRLNVMKYILDKDASLLKVADIHGFMVLHRAAAFGDLDMVKYLVEERNADIYQPTLQPPGNTAVHIAAQKGKLDVFEYLVKEKYVDVNLRNQIGEPPLFSAAERPWMNVVKFLLEQCNADPMILDDNQNNVLYKSAKRGCLILPKYLLDKMKLSYDLDWIDTNGCTIINLASQHNKVGIVNYMIQKNASIFIPDTLKRTPLHHAVSGGFYHLCKLLVEKGASFDVEDVYGVTPLQMATEPRVRKMFFMNAMKNSQDTNRTRRSVPGLESSASHVTSSNSNDWPSLKLLGNENIVDSSPTLHSFLLFVNTIVNRFRDSVYRTAIHPSLRSPDEIMQRRMDQEAVVAAETLLIFEDR